MQSLQFFQSWSTWVSMLVWGILELLFGATCFREILAAGLSLLSVSGLRDKPQAQTQTQL